MPQNFIYSLNEYYSSTYIMSGTEDTAANKINTVPSSHFNRRDIIYNKNRYLIDYHRYVYRQM